MPPTVLLLPGLLCTPQIFDSVLPLLRRAFPALRIDAPALPTHPTMEAVARALLSAHPGPLALCGLSMGGYAALATAAAAPDRVAGLFLLNSHHRADAPEARARRFVAIDKVSAGGAEALVEVAAAQAALLLHPSLVPRDTGAAAREAVRGGVGGVAGSHPCFSLFVRGAIATGSDAFCAQQRANASRSDSAAVLLQLGARGAAVGVATGSHDALIPPALAAEAMGHAGTGKPTIFPECGHLSPLEAPEAVAEAISEWINKLR